jgi:hypothetical protein
MSDQAEMPSPSSKHRSESNPEAVPSAETEQGPDQTATIPAPVPLPEPDPALPSHDQEIVK